MAGVPAGERLAKLEQKTEDMKNTMNSNHTVILKELISINLKIDETMVSKSEFKPVQMIAYGLVGAILIAVLGAIIRLVIIGAT